MAVALATDVAVPLAQQGERYSLPGTDVEIVNVAGEVRVEPGSGSAVVVEITRGGKDAGALRIVNDSHEGRRRLRVVYPGSRVVYPPAGRGSSYSFTKLGEGDFGDRRITVAGRGAGLEAHADLRVLVPSGRKLAIRWGVGRATVANVSGELSLDCAGSPVSVRGTRGVLHVDTGSGEVRALDIEGECYLDTGSGSVVVDGMRGERLKLDSGSGSVRVTDARVTTLDVDTGSGHLLVANVEAPQIELNTGSGGVDLDLAGDIERLDVDTGSGSIEIRLPRSLGTLFDVETSSGSVRIDVPHEVDRHDRNHVRGRIGDGRGQMKVESGSGGIRILPRGPGGARGAIGASHFSLGAGVFLRQILE
jgi:hypothetical protein